MSIALSYSRLSCYEQCPRKFEAQYISKIYPFDGNNPHFIKGKKKHAQLENYIKCENDPTMIQQRYDGDVLDATKIIDRLRAAGYTIEAEHQLAVSEGYLPVGWFDKSVIWRSIADFIAQKRNKAVVGDWKTGKFRDYDGKKTGQLHLSAGIVFAHMPHIDVVDTAYFFIEHKKSIVRRFTREMFETNLMIPFADALIDVNQESEWAPKRNQFCGWCDIQPDCPLFCKK